MTIKTMTRAPTPDEDETYDDFMERCVAELLDDDLDADEAEEACNLAWEGRSVPAVVHKTSTGSNSDDLEFVLSDESVDRMGDVIMVDGWKLANFKRNPIALFGHNSSFIVGTWKNLRKENGELRAKLELAPKGTSDRIDEVIRLVEAGILRATSVGFKPIKHEPLDPEKPYGGWRFLEQELVETSLVSVPANANALAVAKSLKISPATIDLVFAESGNKDTSFRRRGFTGESASTSKRNRKGRAMTLAQRIIDLQTAIVAKQDALEAHIAKMDDSNVSDADLETTNTLNAEIAQLEKTHAALVASEKLLAKTTGENGNGRSRALATTSAFTRPAAGAADDVAKPVILRGGRKKELDPLDYLVHAGTVAYAAKAWGRSYEETRLKIGSEFPIYNDEAVKMVTDLVLRAASAPAMTTVTGWAAELAQTVYSEMMPLLMPAAVFTRLSARGLELNFGRAGKISIPTRSRTPSIAGSFVGEGLPIPVRQGAFTSQILTPKKMAVITVWTREMDVSSTPAIEGVLREAIQQDTSVAMDSILLDTNAATVIRPAGLFNGVAALTPVAGGGLNALVGDLKQLIGALTTGTLGNIRTPVWLMNPAERLSASLTSAAGTGVFPFKEEVGAGTLLNLPIIDSGTVPLKTVGLVDAADFVSVGGDGPRFEMSDQATLHMEDTAPAELVAAGSPGVVASPQRSLFQTDSLALRMILPVNWSQRRAGTVAWVQNVTW